MALKQSWDEVEHGQPGDWCFAQGDTHLIVRLYAAESELMDTGLAALPIKHQADSPNGPVWAWDGDHDEPTLTPSILHGPAGRSERWHGFLTKGKLVLA